MALFLRFGEIPKNEKSINFLKLTFDEIDEFQDYVNMLGYNEAIENIPEYALEDGVSCFSLDETGKPILNNMRLLKSFCLRINKEKAYIINAEQTGIGNDGEPLVKNIKITEMLPPSTEDMAKVVVDILKANFTNAKYDKKADDLKLYHLYHFYDEEQYYYVFRGWRFSNCATDFDLSEGIADRELL